MKKPLVLCIIDGFAFRESAEGNAIKAAKKPNLDRIFGTYPITTLGASGLSVGLPDGQMGNSEVGHTNMGAGRIVYQELTRISKSIKDGDFFENETLKNAILKAKEQNKTVHIMGLMSSGGVHSHIEHCFALIDMCKKYGVGNVVVHPFMDGRDVSPTSGVEFLTELQNKLNAAGIGKIGAVCGRFYAMDRDNRWDRVEKAYNAIVNGEGEYCNDPVKHLEECYQNNATDEFTIPFIANKDCTIKDGDSVIFFNFRPDRAREITRALVDTEFTGFERVLHSMTHLCQMLMLHLSHRALKTHSANISAIKALLSLELPKQKNMPMLHFSLTAVLRHLTKMRTEPLSRLLRLQPMIYSLK